MIETSTRIWPSPTEAAAYFGKIELGSNGRPTDRWEARHLATVLSPYPLRAAWAPEKVIRKITCHRLVVQSLTQCLSRILEHYGSVEAVREARLDLYGGCYNFMPGAGGCGLSLHAHGIAIDLDPERNSPGRKWQEGKGMMPARVVEIFEQAGWSWGGRSSARPDSMHFQATT